MRSRSLVGLGVFTVVLAVYLRTLAPTVTFWDAGEFIATSHILGVPHPPGTPLFVLLGRVWSLLPSPLSIAVKLNLLAAVAGALASLFWFLVLEDSLRQSDRWSDAARYGAASGGALLGAFALTVWQNATETEVYTVAAATVAFLTWLILKWRRVLDRPQHLNLLLLILYLTGLSVGNHLMVFLAGLPILIFILAVRPRVLLSTRLYLLGGVLFLLGISVHLYLYIRAGLDPAINEADPSTWAALWDVLTRKQYEARPFFPRTVSVALRELAGIGFSDFEALFRYQVPLYLSYFAQQWGSPVVVLLITGLGFYGLAHHWRADRAACLYLLALYLITSFGLVLYLNFKLGYSQALAQFPEPALHEVRERDYFFLVSYVTFPLWAGIGTAQLVGRAARVLGRQALLQGALPPLLAILPLSLNFHQADRAGNFIARDLAQNMLSSVDPNGVLFTNGDNDTFPLWYLQQVEGFRRDVGVINLSLLNTDWYIRQLRDQPPPPVGGSQPPPLVRLSDQAIAGLQPQRLQKIEVFRANGIEVTYPAGMLVRVQDLMILHIIQSVSQRRPVYFGTTVSHENRIRLDPYLAMEGLVFRLYHRPLAEAAGEDPSFFQTTWGPYVNVPRARQLLWEVYRFRGTEDPSIFKSETDLGLLNNYGAAHWAVAEALAAAGDAEEALTEFYRSRLFLEERGRFPIIEASLRAMLGEQEAVDSLLTKYLGRSEADSALVGQILRAAGRTGHWSLVDGLVRRFGQGMRGVWMRYEAGEAAVGRREFARALEYYREAMSTSSEFLPGLVRAIQVNHRLGAPETGQALLEGWLTSHPEDTSARRLLEEYQRTGQLPELLQPEANSPLRAATSPGRSEP